jgi:isoamylase
MGEEAVMNFVGNAGHSWPLGATVVDGGINFSVFSRSGTGVELLLFDREDDARPTRVISIDPATNRTYHYWHIFVPGVKAGQIYGYRVVGAFDPPNGMRCADSPATRVPGSRRKNAAPLPA